MSTPRRARVDRWTPAEAAIANAIHSVESIGADERLTDAVVLLQAAKDSVADFCDGIRKRRFVRVVDVDADIAADAKEAAMFKQITEATP